MLFSYLGSHRLIVWLLKSKSVSDASGPTVKGQEQSFFLICNAGKVCNSHQIKLLTKTIHTRTQKIKSKQTNKKKATKKTTKKAIRLFASYQYLLNRAACHNLEMKGSCPSVLLSNQTLHYHSPQICCNQSYGVSLLIIRTPKSFHDRSHLDPAPLWLSLYIPLLNVELFLSLCFLSSPYLFPLQVLWYPARYFMKSIVFTHFLHSTFLRSDGELMISQGSAMGLPIPSADKASPNFPKRTWTSPFEGTVGQKPLCWRVFLRFATSGCSGGGQKKWKPREPRKLEQLQRLLQNKETVAWHTQRAHQRQS